MSGLGRLFAGQPRQQPKKPRISCNCGRRMDISVSGDNSGKKHAHCPTCRLEWHIAPDGLIYCHPYRPRKGKLKEALRKRKRWRNICRGVGATYGRFTVP